MQTMHAGQQACTTPDLQNQAVCRVLQRRFLAGQSTLAATMDPPYKAWYTRP